MAKQVIKKGSTISKKDFDFEAFKEKMGLAVKDPTDLTMSNADKPLEFIPMPKAFSNALKLPGFPQGFMSVITGWSNTGKSTLINCLIASCVDNGIVPVIYDTENNFDFTYAIDCGLKAEPIYGDVEVEVLNEETGEVEVEVQKQIIDWKGRFYYYNSRKLAEVYGDNDYSTGKKVSKKRTTAVIEDIAYSMNEYLEKQENGEFPFPICFIWDSVGSCIGWKSYTSKVGNPMFDAASLSAAFTNLLNSKIPSSRSVASPYTNTFVCVNKIWNDSMNNSIGLPSIELKGGRSFYYAARLILHVGGVAKAGIKKLSATAKGETYNFGIVSKIKVTKNQLPGPWNITYEGEIACVHNGLCVPDEIDDYKKTYMKDILKRIEQLSNGTTVNETDVTFNETETED